MAVENRDPEVHLDRGFWLVTALLGALSIVAIIATLAWHPENLPQIPEAAIPADQVDELFKFLTASAAVIFIYVVGYLVYFAYAFRLRPTDAPDAIGVQIHDHHQLELWWTVVPPIFTVILAVVSVKIWYRVQVQPNNGLVVESIGHQWFDDFRYPGVHGAVTDEMHLPVNVPVTLHVTSSDVIHSFWLPSMRIKADMVPGLINTLRFTPIKPGRYPIICTEFCGTLHGTMNKQVVVIESQSNFDKWLAGWKKKNANVSDALPAAGAGAVNLAGGTVAGGQKLFANKCSACHAVGPYSQKIVGPGLKGVLHDPSHPNLVNGEAATPQDVAKILQKGYDGDLGHMPNATQNGIGDKDIADLVAYLNSLK
ncbi:MAG: cytochrome c oxidase subunit II [Vulcanimicrobiaceae bacterium]